MKFKNLGLFKQLTILVSLVIVLTVTLNAAFTFYQLQQSLRQTVEERGRVLVDIASTFLFNPLYSLRVSDIDEVLNSLVAEEDIVFVLVRNIDGEIVRTAGADQAANADLLSTLATWAINQRQMVWQVTADQLFITGPISVGSVQIGTLTIGLSLQPIAEQLRIATISVVLSSLVALGLSLSGVFLVSRYLTRPIQALTAAAEAIGQGEYDISLHQEGAQELQVLGQTFEMLAASLKQSEAEISARIRGQEMMAALSERLNAILDLEDLLVEMVNQVKDNFGYYHAHIYLLDDTQQKLVVAAGTGQAGEEMKAKGHNIALNAPTSLVARAARSGEVVRVDNVRLVDDWLSNPLLPDTCSEMAVPILLESQVVGVLDVQQDKVAGLDERDAGLLRSLASQVAVAIRNARLFEEVETALAEAQAAQERYLEQSWQQAKASSRSGQYYYARPDASILSEAVIVQAKQAALTGNDPAIVTLEQNGSEDVADTSAKSIVAPIKLRNTAIGSLQLHPLRNDQSWSEDDLAVVEAVVDELAQAAESLRLFEETRERASFESLVAEITEKLRQAPTLDILTKTAAEALGNALGVSHSLIKVGTMPGTTDTAPNGSKGQRRQL